MNIQSTHRLPAQTRLSKAPKQEEEQKPKESWQQQTADYLERSNDSLTPQLAAIGLAAKFAIKGNQITESLHPVAKAVGIIGGGAVGAFVGLQGGTLLQNINSTATDAVFGQDTGLAKSIVSVGLNSAAFGLVGGWQGAALHGLATAGGAAHIARQDVMLGA